MQKFTALIFFFGILLNPFFMSAQSKGKIMGTVKNANQEAVLGATVTLTKAKNDALIKATFTDADGRFEFDKLNIDSCKITVSFVGLNKYNSEIIVLSSQNSHLELPLIVLLEAKTADLQEVTVTAKKPFVERKIDRTVINPEALISNAGTTSLEVLEKSPGVLVDVDGNISLKGKSGVVVFIDDKPTYLSAADLVNYLRGIPSSTIQSIEIMTNPPAKYEAAGNAGVINIKLKKNLAKGFNGGINMSYGQGRYMRTNNSVNFNYRINKFNFFSNISVNQNNSYQDLTIWRRYFKPTGEASSAFTQNSYILRINGSTNAKVGFDYYPSKKSTLGVVLSGFRNPAERNVDNNASIRNANNEITGLVEAISPTNSLWKNGSVNLNYAYKIDSTGKELTTNLDYINYNAEQSQILTNTIYSPDNKFVSQSILASSLPSSIVIQTAKIDYLNPLKSGGRFETGLKTSFVNTNNVADFSDVFNNTYTPNYEFSNNFKYDENINAAYVNYSKDFKKLSVQAGLRFENTNIKGYQLGNKITKDSSFTREYSNFFPTIYFSYKLDTTDTHQLGLNFGRRIDRPDYQSMNPFTYPLDRFTYYAGNPFLQPTFSYNFELSHTYKNRLTTTLEYSETENVIFETNEQRGNIFYSRPGNFAKRTDYGISFNGTFQPTKWWTIQLYTIVKNVAYNTPVYTETINESRFYWYAGPTNQFVLSKLWSAELAATYQTRILAGQFLTIPVWAIRAGVSKKIFKEKGTFKFNVSDIFYTFQTGGDIRNIANASANWFSYLDSRVATVAISYRFSKGQNLKLRQTGGSDSEKSRVKS
jgi:iron complex outermembrane recepter protein